MFKIYKIGLGICTIYLAGMFLMPRIFLSVPVAILMLVIAIGYVVYGVRKKNEDF
jgi:pilus assembly protein TadC